MKRIIIALMMLPLTVLGQTLDACQQAAEQNYPLIRQYGLIDKTTALTVANIAKGWLPQVSASAQATLQSDVTAFPDQMEQMYRQMGIAMEGLRKDQYRVGIDVQQTVYDGGAIRSQKEVAREQGAVQTAQTAVTLYQVRQRVNDMYFALLLTDEQIRLNNDLQQLLSSNEQKLASMFEHGTASESDYLAVKAERLNAMQQLTSLQSQRATLVRLLSVFCGIEVSTPERPANHTNSAAYATGQRPELTAIDAQLRLTDARERALNTQLLPKVGVFAQGFYGYPGYNLFEDMMRRKFSWNGMIGARLTWNIGALYTRKNDKAALDTQRSALNVQRDVFTFNNSLEQMQHNDDIARYRQLLAADAEIVALRQSVRRAAESRLSHGIIDVNDLVKEINAENAAQVQQSIHEIEMLKEIYDLKEVISEK